ncbi:MAG: indole-3-glycerol phosphate synthase TrpC [Kiritimatiellae bacterium]|nr:indole-3-glycerol phosphate synthase TrpC [Kiritimatiellia bacterium]
MNNDILEELSGLRREDAARREASVSFDEMMRRAKNAPAARDFKAAFVAGGDGTKPVPPGPRVIAELKRASPSEGMIREDFRPVELAKELEAAGAAALSVLCEPHRFLGSEDYLRAVREAANIPLLYKDFVTTRYQIAAARAAGADAVLLIAAVLDDAALKDLLGFAHDVGLAALVETHDEREIDRAVAADAGIVGVNCRNLRNFSTDVSLLESLMGRIPRPCVRIAESGMHTAEAVVRAKTAGADGFLVGTALMRAERPGAKLRELLTPTP